MTVRLSSVCVLVIAGLFSGLLSMAQAADQTALMLVYEESEHGGEPYQSRYLITPGYLRIDYGRDVDDYILVDRKTNRLSNVTHETKRLMLLDQQPVTVEPPFELRLSLKQSTQAGDMPVIAGVQPEHHLLSVNGQACEDVVAADGLFADAVAAMAQFRQILAGQQAATLSSTPADMIDACEIALHIFYPDAVLKQGLPIRRWDKQGRRSQLVDIQSQYPVSPLLFTVPEGYSSYRISPQKP